MRIAGALLVLLGIVAAVTGTFMGCGSLFSWNGRHPVETRPLGAGEVADTQPLVPVPGRRYTVSVVVVFDREGVERQDGVAVVHAKMPLVVRVKDAAGTTLAEATGWLDPEEPPNVLYGQAAHESMRGPTPELAVERLVGPFNAASAAPLAVSVTLGPDRVGATRIASRRLVVYDDATPPSIKNHFIVAGSGVLAAVVGIVLLVAGWFRRRGARAGSPGLGPRRTRNAE